MHSNFDDDDKMERSRQAGAEGDSFGKCALLSILSSVPQPLAAVPAALAVWLFAPLLAVGLGFAGGAMIYLVVLELIPEALEEGGQPHRVGSDGGPGRDVADYESAGVDQGLSFCSPFGFRLNIASKKLLSR